jgi:hypothetical protein
MLCADSGAARRADPVSQQGRVLVALRKHLGGAQHRLDRHGAGGVARQSNFNAAIDECFDERKQIGGPDPLTAVIPFMADSSTRVVTPTASKRARTCAHCSSLTASLQHKALAPLPTRAGVLGITRMIGCW